LHPEIHQQDTTGDMDAAVIEIFRGTGFEWGGDWTGRCEMVRTSSFAVTIEVEQRRSSAVTMSQPVAV
jgi:hypothetical protein